MEVLPTLPRRERERLERRALMLSAARAVFAEKGYEQATLDEVAERAEFGKGTLYNYFEGGKEGILRALIDDVFDDVEHIIAAHVERDEPIQALFLALLTDLLAHFEANRDTFLLVVKEVQRLMLSPENAVVRLVWERDARVMALITVPIQRAIDSGQLRPFPAEGVARMLFGNTEGLMMHYHCQPGTKGREPFSPAQAADFITSILFEGLRPRTA